jgi:hypothetical protein
VKTRGCHDIRIAVPDGLKGMSDALADVRHVLYTTNALESVPARLRKILKSRGQFPTDEAPRLGKPHSARFPTAPTRFTAPHTKFLTLPAFSGCRSIHTAGRRPASPAPPPCLRVSV